jgi:aspartyl-tRNA(Asn)/glutamyl-tRNA(Gln) amidotransferase subunit B
MKKEKKLTPTIGMETHVELRTESKMFCGCPADHFAKPPNTQTCPVCLGLPGALPVPNRKAVEWTIMLGLALNCKIAKFSKFDRKHYFYPDLPKGYQISQYDQPLCLDGYLETKEGRIRITRVHLEEDTGKLRHKMLDSKNVTLVDFNRSGVALLEIVTEPDIGSGSQAKEYTQKLQNIIRYLGISDCDMEKGSMRLEANISWGVDWDYKVEVKNLNSFRFVDKAINYELERQKKILLMGEVPKQETRGWSESESKTVHQRYKETASDYRYFPEPDIPPMKFTDDFIKSIKAKIPELPEEKSEILIDKYKLRKDYADILVSRKGLLEFAEKLLSKGVKKGINPDVISNYLINQKIDLKKESVDSVLEIISEKESTISYDEKIILNWVDIALKETPQAVKDYKKGKVNAIAAIVGSVMRISKGKADPGLSRKFIEERLKT